MAKVIAFVKESYNELVHKVTWPSYSSLQNSAVLVLVASLIFSLVIAGIDFLLEGGMKGIYNAF